MRRTILAAAVLGTSLLATAAASRASDLSFDPWSQYPRLPSATVAAEHFDYPLPAQMFYREAYGDIGGYGYPDPMTTDREFTSSTPVYMLRHRGSVDPGDPRPGGMGRVRGMVGQGEPVAVAQAPLHYLVPDFVGTRTVSQDGESHRTVTPGRYVDAYERGRDAHQGQARRESADGQGTRRKQASRRVRLGRRDPAQADPPVASASSGGAEAPTSCTGRRRRRSRSARRTPSARRRSPGSGRGPP